MPQLNPPYKEQNIKDLNSNTLKIAITGLIVSKSENMITIDDRTGSLPVLIDTDLPVNTFVKVYGILIPSDQGFELQGNLIQDLSKINQELYKKVKSSLQ